MNPKIVVLMSTYNGERYLREQIESVLNQENVDVTLEIRDDGSSDNTISILEEYESKDNRVILHKGSNIGPMNSFFLLLKKATPCNYYAFCDQDDYWEKNKLSIAIDSLSSYNSQIPLLYCSNLSVVDANLNFCRLFHTSPINCRNKYIALVDSYAVGCTEVFNACAAEYMRRYTSEDALMHDSWLLLLCNFFGKVIYDPIPHIIYRQHGNNVIGVNINKWDRIMKSFKRIKDKSIQPRLKSAKALLKRCKNLLNNEDRYKIERVVNYKRSIIDRFLLFLDYDIRSNRIFSDIKYRVLILIGLI